VRESGTETAFQNEFWNNERTGIYVESLPANHSSLRSTNSIAASACPRLANRSRKISSSRNRTLRNDMQRTEVRAKRSNAHLGHLFPDPKSPTGQRYAVKLGRLPFHSNRANEEEGYEAFLSLLEKKPAVP